MEGLQQAKRTLGIGRGWSCFRTVDFSLVLPCFFRGVKIVSTSDINMLLFRHCRIKVTELHEESCLVLLNLSQDLLRQGLRINLRPCPRWVDLRTSERRTYSGPFWDNILPLTFNNNRFHFYCQWFRERLTISQIYSRCGYYYYCV